MDVSWYLFVQGFTLELMFNCEEDARYQPKIYVELGPLLVYKAPCEHMQY